MLKQSVGLVSLLWALGLHSSLQVLLASEPIFLYNNSYNSAVKSTESSYSSVTQPTRLKISLSHRQVTVYKGKSRIKSYPIAVGRRGWETPTGNFRVDQMLRNPTWINPFTGESIPGATPKTLLVPTGLGFGQTVKNSIGFHGTPNPESVGKPASHGCIRMYNKDVEELFHQVNLGTQVTVVR